MHRSMRSGKREAGSGGGLETGYNNGGSEDFGSLSAYVSCGAE
jgi:hypothetical protein